MWLVDEGEPEGGFWCYMGADEKNFLYQLNGIYYEDDQPETLDNTCNGGTK